MENLHRAEKFFIDDVCAKYAFMWRQNFGDIPGQTCNPYLIPCHNLRSIWNILHVTVFLHGHCGVRDKYQVPAQINIFVTEQQRFQVVGFLETVNMRGNVMRPNEGETGANFVRD